jgi:hypothetical protein
MQQVCLPHLGLQQDCMLFTPHSIASCDWLSWSWRWLVTGGTTRILKDTTCCCGKNVVRTKIIQYRRLSVHRPHPIVFFPITVNTSGLLYDDFYDCVSCTVIERLVLGLENYPSPGIWSVPFSSHCLLGSPYEKGSVGFIFNQIFGWGSPFPWCLLTMFIMNW